MDTEMQVPQGAVVVGLDGSEDSVAALEWAADHATRGHRPLALVHAADEAAAFSRVYVTGAGIDPRQLVADALEAGEKQCRGAHERVAALHPALQITEHVTREDPRTSLLRASETASLVVVGSRGRGPVGSLLLGSVGVALSRHAAAPVVVLRPGRVAGPTAPVVVGVDATPSSRPVLEMAFSLAEERGVPLTVVHTHADQAALAYGLPSMVDAVDVENATRDLAEALAGFSQDHPGVDVRRELRAQVTLDALLELGADASLLVVGRHHPPGLRGVLHHGTATSLLERATTPVVVVPVP